MKATSKDDGGGNLSEYVVALRREFHRNAELSFKEFNTSKIIFDELRKLGLKPVQIAGTGVYADINGRLPGKTVALRADIDALPLNENSGDEFASRNPGAMHACGHDGHIAMLLGVARKFMSDPSFPGRIRLLFQPAEEAPPGGAIKMIEEGALKDVDYILGQHVISTLPSGTIGINYDYGAAISDEFFIKISGPGGHGSRPHETSDVVYVTSLFIVSSQALISRMTDQTQPSVLTFGTIKAGDRFNIIASNAEISGTVRTYSKEVRDRIRDGMKNLLESICRVHGSEFSFHYEEGYPALLNDQKVASVVDRVAKSVVGKENVVYPSPTMGGEDFSRFLEVVPGAFFRLGVGNAQMGINAPQHSPRYRMDESALVLGVNVMYGAALELLLHGTD
ncbi:MAG: amidohydrolase [Candidatus Thermoplasmatota archaeon]|nr:amidohydrolase [Candidatus Thermoplasmatota archaeon]